MEKLKTNFFLNKLEANNFLGENPKQTFFLKFFPLQYK